MNKWLKDRQLGKIVKKETILENISKCLKFEYKGTIEFRHDNSRLLAHALQWINNGRNLVALISDYTNNELNKQMIAIWKDQNIHTGQRLESKIDLGLLNRDKHVSSLICKDSSTLLYGWIKNEQRRNKEGFISNISMETGKVESSLRNWLQHFLGTVY